MVSKHQFIKNLKSLPPESWVEEKKILQFDGRYESTCYFDTGEYYVPASDTIFYTYRANIGDLEISLYRTCFFDYDRHRLTDHSGPSDRKNNGDQITLFISNKKRIPVSINRKEKDVHIFYGNNIFSQVRGLFFHVAELKEKYKHNV